MIRSADEHFVLIIYFLSVLLEFWSEIILALQLRLQNKRLSIFSLYGVIFSTDQANLFFQKKKFKSHD